MNVANGRLLRTIPTFSKVSITCAPVKFIGNMRTTKNGPLVVPVNTPRATTSCVTGVSKLLLAKKRSISPGFCNRRPDLRVNTAFPLHSSFRVTLIRRTLGRGGPVLTIYHNLRVLGIRVNNDLCRSLTRRCPSVHVRRMRGASFGCTARSIVIVRNDRLRRLINRGLSIGSFRRRTLGIITGNLRPIKCDPSNLIRTIRTASPRRDVLTVR